MGQRIRKTFAVIFAALCLIALAGKGDTERNGRKPVQMQKQDSDFNNPAKAAAYAMEYCGWDSIVDINVGQDIGTAEQCVQWLINHADTENNCCVWKNTGMEAYTGRAAKGQWIGAYTQAMVMDAFMAYYDCSGEDTYLEWAQKAADILSVNVSDGGLLTKKGDFIWFETVNTDPGNWELIGHLRVVVSLKHLAERTNRKEDQELFEKASDTLKKLLKYFDTDYCLRDDLRIKEQIKFCFFNDYGEENHTELIKKLTMKDSVNGKKLTVENIDKNGVFTCDFLLDGSQWFRKEWLELVVEYKDEAEQHVTLKKESMLDEDTWVPIKDGDFFMTGNGGEKEWVIPLRINDFGYEVSAELMGQYAGCFAALSEGDDTFASIKDRSAAYYNIHMDRKAYHVVDVEQEELPTQTPLTAICSFDAAGVLRQHGAVMGVTQFEEDGTYHASSPVGEPFYSLYAICKQAVYGKDYWNFYKYDIKSFTDHKEFWQSYDFLSADNLDRIEKRPAYQWLKNHVKRSNGFAVWTYDFYNCYNNLEQQSGWKSAYGQSLVLDALMYHSEKYQELIREGGYAFGVLVEDGGLAAKDDKENLWFEEVPNKSHILNADILSINTLYDVNTTLKDKKIEALINAGIEGLKNKLWCYDTGYWSKYDMNPKKESLFQIDWLGGKESPFIDSITVWDPINDIASQIDVGEDADSTGYPFIAGTEWGEAVHVDGVSVRAFENGYLKEHAQDAGTTEQNVYFYGVLPSAAENDYFDVLGYKLVIRYKDTAKGEFEVKRQSICEGNYLEFEQMPNARIICTGDGKWKEKEIWIRAQDLGWYMGKDYQKYHIEQLEKLAQNTNDIFFEQYAEKWKYYLEGKDGHE